MPSNDIRVCLSLKDHRKLKRLIRKVGMGAMHYLIMLWLVTAEQCPNGHLRGWDEKDIADAAQWKRKPQLLVDALTSPECLWLDRNGDGYHIHDWEKYQGWALHAEDRSAIARHAVKTRWDKIRAGAGVQNSFSEKSISSTPNDTPSILRVSSQNSASNTPYPYPTPSPNPYPTPNLGTVEEQKTWEQRWGKLFHESIVPIYLKKTDLCDYGAKLFYFMMGTGDISDILVQEQLIPFIRQKNDSDEWRKEGGRFIPQFAKLLEWKGWRTADIDPKYLPEDLKRKRRMQHNPYRVKG